MTKAAPDNNMGRMPASSLKILVVDDDRATLLMLSARLIREGYRVLTAADGEDAWEAARR